MGRARAAYGRSVDDSRPSACTVSRALDCSPPRHAVVHDRLRARHGTDVSGDAHFGPSGAGSVAALRSCRRRRTIRPSTPSPARSSTSCGWARGEVWFARYYGTVDATPLFLVLLSRCGAGRATMPRCASSSPHEAGAPLDRRVWRSRRRWVCRVARRSGHGLACSRGRTRRIRSASPTAASRRPIASVEVQGLRLRRQAALCRARPHVLADEHLAVQLERDAAELRERFDRSFWVERTGEGSTRSRSMGRSAKVDSRCSNMGHLLWSGIVADGASPSSPELSSMARCGRDGACVRCRPATRIPAARLPPRHGVAARQRAHPHGLSLRGESAGALRIVRSLFEASRFFEGSLPEVFAVSRAKPRRSPSLTPRPRDHSLAAGAPVCFCACCSASSPTRSHVHSSAERPAAHWAGDLTLYGLRAFGRRSTLSSARRTTLVVVADA